jgi:purine catabolism regulator
MSITVAQALTIGGLTRGRLVTHPVNLDNIIEYVDIIEVPDISAWEAGNHLFLTTFYAVRNDLAQQIRIIELLAEKKCAALVFQQGPLAHPPKKVVERANEVGLPLIEVPEDVEYRSIITPLVGAILKEKTFLLQRSQNIHRRLMDLILEGRGYKSLAEALSELIYRPVAIIDIWDNQVATADFPQNKRLWDEIIHEVFHQLGKQKTAPYWNASMGIWLAPILSGPQSTEEGFIVVYDPDKALAPFDMIAIEQTSTIAALDLVKRKAVLEAERHSKRDFLEDILRQHHRSPDALLSRARLFGWTLKGKRVVMFITLRDPTQWPITPTEYEDIFVKATRERFLRIVSQIVIDNNPQSIVVERIDGVTVLPHFQEGMHPVSMRRHVGALAEFVSEQVSRRLNGQAVQVIIGGFVESVLELNRSYREANHALLMQRKLGLDKTVVWYDDVALYVQLDQLLTHPEAQRWLNQIIGPLVNYDRYNDSELVKTLEVYFDANQTSQRAAKQLFIHPKTLKYRLRRIKEILGEDPFQGDCQLRYYLATKMVKLQEVEG